ncbi:MAG: bifunctional histidinol-phosphatase/imidazoleglycerol-phosphate dehydratase HisB [Saprospiraceae bacterium]|nr:bifunctional histidinol-phosphatase/imidazoleglycerol-phosphate dehydratase HisB [Pyrinomonadaceae bacterium]
MKTVLFIDRDGTIIEEPEDFQIDSFAKLKFLSGAITYLAKIANECDFELVMVTNQDGLGTDAFPDADFQPVHDFMIQTLANEGVNFADVYIDRTFAEENAPTRKPNTGMLGKYLSGEYDLTNSYVIGDRSTDVELARNLGAKAIFIKNRNFKPHDDCGSDIIEVDGWREIYERLRLPERRILHKRKTNETDISIDLNLDGSGRAEINTGIAFFDHMLDQLARHGSLDLKIEVSGDLHIDEHHTIEDLAITLGEAFAIALKEKTGMERYGFVLPMDDCLAQVALDFGGRNWIVWDAEFKREMIGKMPTEMFFHFFKSFTDKALCNLNIKAEGFNEHHKIEAIFKAFAKAIKMAVRRDPVNAALPSTKGVL